MTDLEKRLAEALRRIADPRNTHFAGDAQVVAREALAAFDAQQAEALAYVRGDKLPQNTAPGWYMVGVPAQQSEPNEPAAQREAFEAWFCRAYHSASLQPMEAGCYLNRGAGMAWDAWKARAAQPSQPLPVRDERGALSYFAHRMERCLQDFPERGELTLQASFVRDCAAEIRAALQQPAQAVPLTDGQLSRATGLDEGDPGWYEKAAKYRGAIAEFCRINGITATAAGEKTDA